MFNEIIIIIISCSDSNSQSNCVKLRACVCVCVLPCNFRNYAFSMKELRERYCSEPTELQELFSTTASFERYS